MKEDKVKYYGGLVFPLTTPTSKIRSELGDQKNAEATLRNLNNILLHMLPENMDGMRKENHDNHDNNKKIKK